jgi:ArsR family transcriptional regulator, arsenate/arsenite/antimonite-responsive transcriptional repressor
MSTQLFPEEITSESAVGAELGELDRLFRGFADPTRLRLLNLLVPGPLRVGDLVELLALPQPLVSRHLAYLRRVGLVGCDRGPRSARYFLADPTGPVHETLLACVRSSFGANARLSAERAAAALRFAAQPSI